MPKEDVTYLKRIVRSKHELRDSSVKEMMKKIVEVRHKKTPSSNASALGLSFVKVTICGRKFVMLIDTGATNNFLSKKATMSLKLKTEMEREVSAFKGKGRLVHVLESWI